MINNNTKWITSDLIAQMSPDRDSESVVSLCFRREFNIDKSIHKANLYICALGLGVCSINGKRISEDVLSTPYTRYDKRVIYQKYNVTELIVKGKNAIGVHVGNGFYNNNMITWNDKMAPWRDNPKLAVALHIVHMDGTEKVVLTDEEWKCDFGPCVYNHMRQGEKFDARLIQQGFDMPDFDDSKWQHSVRAYAPGGVLEENFVSPVRIVKKLEAVKLENGIYDFGENISGWVDIVVTGDAGQEIKIIYDESLDKNGNLLGGSVHKYAKQEGHPLCQECIYICGGNDNEEYHPEFCYFGFRYVQILNAPKDIKVVAHFVHTDFEQIGSFKCSDETINAIHEMCVRSLKSNFVGNPTDCPHREQNGWTGDALVSADTTLMNFDAYNNYRKWLHDFTDAQRDNGHLPGIIPTGGWGYTGTFGPAWDCAVVLIPYKTYLHTGKTEIVSDMWATMTKYMSFLETMSENYLVGYGLGDWCPPDFDNRVSNFVTDTAIYYDAAYAMSKMAELIGEDSQPWKILSQNIRNAWRSKFVDFENKVISDDYNKYQTFYACALYYKFYDNDNERVFLVESLVKLIKEKDYHIDCGILGIMYIFAALSDNGYSNIAYRMITNPTYPGYVHWINRGMTTLCETWGMGCSRNHQMFGAVDNWFYMYLGGIRYTENGILIKPEFIEEIASVSVEHCGIKVERNDNKVSISTPVNVTVFEGGICKILKPGKYEYTL